MVVETLVAKVTAGVQPRFESVVLMGSLALGIVTFQSVSTHKHPLETIADLGRWLGWDWDAGTSMVHQWVAARGAVVEALGLCLVLATLTVVLMLAQQSTAARLWSNLRWAVPLIVCASVFGEIDGGFRPWWVVGLWAATAVVHWSLIRRGDMFVLFLAAPICLVILPFAAFGALLVDKPQSSPADYPHAESPTMVIERQIQDEGLLAGLAPIRESAKARHEQTLAERRWAEAAKHGSGRSAETGSD